MPLGLVLLLAAASATLGCKPDTERPLGAPPGEPSHPVVIRQSAKLDSVETDAIGPNGEPTRVRCATCHARVDVGEVALAPEDLKEFHQGLTFTHGTLACASCHEPNEPLLLHLATGETVPTTEAMQLCAQCHGPQKKSYDHGAHGGMTGHWDLSRGPRVRNHCVDCHDPHAPQIPKVQPVLRPVDRGKTPDLALHPKVHH